MSQTLTYHSNLLFNGLRIPNFFNHSSSDDTAGSLLFPSSLAIVMCNFPNVELKSSHYFHCRCHTSISIGEDYTNI